MERAPHKLDTILPCEFSFPKGGTVVSGSTRWPLAMRVFPFRRYGSEMNKLSSNYY